MYRVTRFEGQPITGVSASVGFRVEVNESARTSVRVEIPAEWQDRLICEISPEGWCAWGSTPRAFGISAATT
ncbi:MAG: hypothetical protein ACLR8Y_07430 [Alistipes indistinctus]